MPRAASRTAPRGHASRAAAAFVLAALLAALAPAGAGAHGYKFGDIEVGHVWAPPVAAGAEGAAVYGPLLNEGKTPVKLIAASSPVAAQVRFRIKKDGAESWLDTITLVPDRPFTLAAWKEHIWLSGLTGPLNEGTSFKLTLDFGDQGRHTVEVVVETTPSD